MPRHRPAGRAAASADRAAASRPLRERILIVCEGAETEPNYFNALVRVHRLNTVQVSERQLDINAVGVGKNTRSLVEEALSRQGQGPNRYAEIWCVFDKDDFPADNFDNAIARARNHPFLRVAWSNEAFELWYVLHFEYLDTSPAYGAGKPRHHYAKRLDALLRPLDYAEYDKADPTLYERLGPARLQEAIRNARRLRAVYPDETPAHRCKPATTVYELVEKLLSFAPEAQPAIQTLRQAGR